MKAAGNQSEESVLIKAFKYFDMNNSGDVDPIEFKKAIEKIGIIIPTKSDLETLFGIYDEDGSGAISYKEFAAALFGKPSTAQSQRPGTAATKSPEELADLLNQKLCTRGSRGFIGLQRQFKIMDDDRSGYLDKKEFTKAMTDYMLGFNEKEITTLFNYFDVDKSGTIDFGEFVRAIRGEMTPERKKTVMLAFNKLDKDGNGWIDISDIKGVYNASRHPDVLQGKKNEDQILQEFLETFETAHSMRNNGTPNHVVTKDEFVEYYNNISASIDDDKYFTLMINNAWKLTEESRQGNGTKGWTNKANESSANNGISGSYQRRAPVKEDGVPANATEEMLLKHIQTTIANRGARGIAGIQRKFKIADDNNSKSLDKNEFKKAMHDFRIGLNDRQVGLAFDIFDRDGSGEISYDEFLRTIRGEMNDARKATCMRAFKIMDKDGSGVLDLNDIRQSYNAKQHPDVKSGKKTEDQVLGEFLDTFEDHFCNIKGNADARDGKINAREWIEYYNNVSMSIDNDEYFALMMNNTWNLDGSRVTKKGWGGEV